MRIVYLNGNVVREVLPEATYAKGAEYWYGAAFASRCTQAPDEVSQGWIYDPATGTFSPPDETEDAP